MRDDEISVSVFLETKFKFLSVLEALTDWQQLSIFWELYSGIGLIKTGGRLIPANKVK